MSRFRTVLAVLQLQCCLVLVRSAEAEVGLLGGRARTLQSEVKSLDLTFPARETPDLWPSAFPSVVPWDDNPSAGSTANASTSEKAADSHANLDSDTKADSEANVNSTWYVLGYGSLFSEASRIRSECGLRGVSEEFLEWSFEHLNIDAVFDREKAECIRKQQAKVHIPVTVQGFRRGFYDRGVLPNDVSRVNGLFTRPTYLGMVRDSDHSVTGLLFEVSEEGLRLLDEREAEGGYSVETIDLGLDSVDLENQIYLHNLSEVSAKR